MRVRSVVLVSLSIHNEMRDDMEWKNQSNKNSFSKEQQNNQLKQIKPLLSDRKRHIG